MRLIDAYELLNSLGCSDLDIEVSHIVEGQPTAYEVDEVVKELEKLKDTEHDDSIAEMVSTKIWNKAIQKAISVVKEYKGATNEIN